MAQATVKAPKRERTRKRLTRKPLSCFAATLLFASSFAQSQDVCALCEYQYRQCVRSGTRIDVCGEQHEAGDVMNGCMVAR